MVDATHVFSDFRGVCRSGGGPLAALAVAGADGAPANAAAVAARLLDEGTARAGAGAGAAGDTTAHLEAQLAAARAVGAPDEYVYWYARAPPPPKARRRRGRADGHCGPRARAPRRLGLYAEHLAGEGDERRLRALAAGLLGPLTGDARAAPWDAFVLVRAARAHVCICVCGGGNAAVQGRPKRALLRDVVLRALQGRMDLQRLCNEIADSLLVAERLSGSRDSSGAGARQARG